MSESRQDDPTRIKNFRDAVRLRPGMYFGTTGLEAIEELVYNILDVPVSEALLGHCTHVIVSLHDKNAISVQDNGHGLPIEPDPKSGEPIIRISPNVALRSRTWPDYKILVSRHALGTDTVNAVCSKFQIEFKRNGILSRQMFEEGLEVQPLEIVRRLAPDEVTGSTITFSPDFTIFQSDELDFARLSRKLREIAFLVPGLKITLEDLRSNGQQRREIFFSEFGVSDLVRQINRDYEVLHEPIEIKKTVALEQDHKPLGISASFDIALQYANTYQPVILFFMNGIEVEYGGPHLTGLKDALERVVVWRAQRASAHDFPTHGFTEDDYLNGLTAVISMQHPKPEVCNSLYFVLSNPELEDAVEKLVRDAMQEFAETHPEQMQRIVDKCLANKAQRLKRRYID